MKIVFSGGGTLGPVTPLLAIYEALLAAYPDAHFVWVGTKNGPEKEIVEKVGISFFTIGAGKWRRYISFWNITDLIKIGIAFWQSFFFIIKERPDILISAGGFVSVPLHLAGACLGVPSWVHQQDIYPGLANKLMFPFAKRITTALKETAILLKKKRAEWIGNPSRDLSVVSRDDSRKRLGIPPGVPVIFALGGGTGSTSINNIVIEALPHWPRDWHIIHLVGKERPQDFAKRAMDTFSNYHVYPFFIDEMKDAYAASTVVISRAGFGTLTELAALSKPAVILPMFDTHQEDNARYFFERGGIVMLEKGESNGLKLAHIISEIMYNTHMRDNLGRTLHAILPIVSREKIVAIFDSIV